MKVENERKVAVDVENAKEEDEQEQEEQETPPPGKTREVDDENEEELNLQENIKVGIFEYLGCSEEENKAVSLSCIMSS